MVRAWRQFFQEFDPLPRKIIREISNAGKIFTWAGQRHYEPCANRIVANTTNYRNATLTCSVQRSHKVSADCHQNIRLLGHDCVGKSRKQSNLSRGISELHIEILSRDEPSLCERINQRLINVAKLAAAENKPADARNSILRESHCRVVAPAKVAMNRRRFTRSPRLPV
jgi:hypothetical protein